MTGRLSVELCGQPIGTLGIEGPMRSPEDWTFGYLAAAAGASHPRALSLSLSMPWREEPYRGAVVRNWFCNLLPEGAVRDAVVARLRLPQRDDFALLAAIGGECAGAVSVYGDRAAATHATPGDSDIDALLARQGDFAGEGAWSLIGAPRRLSLAGAQDKLAVIRESGGRLRLPLEGEPSTHILKPDSRRFIGLRDLEALGLAVAQGVGLETAAATLVEAGGRPALLVERYDRQRGADGVLSRLHQEDFCQALGYPGELKYEAGGGPSLAACAALLRRHALGATALQALLDWAIFNVVIGNADAHAKNLSLLHPPAGPARVAPLYDLVPTIVLPESLVERELALRIGGATRIDAITADDWRQFARACGYGAKFVLERVRTLAQAVIGQLPRSAASIIEHGGDPTRLQRAVAVLTEHAKRVSAHR